MGLGHGTANGLYRTTATTLQRASRRRDPELDGEDTRIEQSITRKHSDGERREYGKAGNAVRKESLVWF
jgi:hypothetical protein